MILGKIWRSFTAQLNKLANFFWTSDPVAQLQYEYDSAVAQMKEGREGLERYRALPRIDDCPVWSVACFFVASKFRRQGTTLGLLRAAVSYARSHGANVVEGYPVEPDSGLEHAASLADILAEEDHVGVARHLLGDAAGDGVAIGQFRHAQPPSA